MLLRLCGNHPYVWQQVLTAKIIGKIRLHSTRHTAAIQSPSASVCAFVFPVDGSLAQQGVQTTFLSLHAERGGNVTLQPNPCGGL